MTQNTKSVTLAEFLLARIAEDRIVANQSQRDPWRVGHKSSCDSWGDVPGYCTYDATARALAECEAKRRIVGIYRHVNMSEPDEGLPSVPLGGDGPETYYEAIQHLAAVYSDHPDYQPEWRP